VISGEAPPISQARLATMSEGSDDPYVPLAGRFPQYEEAFLAAIDQSLRVPPKDRIASAKEWLALIETESKKVKMVNIPESKNLGKTLSELVSETNKHVMSAPRTPTPPPQPEVKSRVLSVDESYRPAWVDEFNRETHEAALRKLEDDQAAAAARAAEAASLNREARIAEQKALMEDVPNQRAAEDDETPKGLLRMPAKAKPRNILDWVSRSKPD
jgi:hypothetical protein